MRRTYQGSLIHHPEPTPHERAKRADRIRQIIGGILLGLLIISPILIALIMRYGR